MVKVGRWKTCQIKVEQLKEIEEVSELLIA